MAQCCTRASEPPALVAHKEDEDAEWEDEEDFGDGEDAGGNPEGDAKAAVACDWSKRR